MADNWVYRIGHSLSSFLFEHVMGSEGYGLENIPKRGPFLLACNHSSFLDPFVAGCFFKRDIYFFARKTLFKPGLTQWVLSRFNSIPVDREGADVQSMKQVLTLLKRGEGLLVFPEGTRSKDGQIHEAKRGVGMMACRMGVPVVPLRLFGAYEAWGREEALPDFNQKIIGVYGKALLPVDYDSGQGSPTRYQEAADRIVQAIREIECPSPVII